jgi:hypothetical protein
MQVLEHGAADCGLIADVSTNLYNVAYFELRALSYRALRKVRIISPFPVRVRDPHKIVAAFRRGSPTLLRVVSVLNRHSTSCGGGNNSMWPFSFDRT